jgi:hypothetical protein
VHDHVTPACQPDPLNLVSLLPHGLIGDSWSDRLQKSVFESEAVTRVTGGGAKPVQAVARGGGGSAVAPGGRLAPTVAAAPHNRVRVRGLVIGFIANELEKVRGRLAQWQVAARWRGHHLNHERGRSDDQTTVRHMGRSDRVTGDPFINSKFLFF